MPGTAAERNGSCFGGRGRGRHVEDVRTRRGFRSRRGGTEAIRPRRAECRRPACSSEVRFIGEIHRFWPLPSQERENHHILGMVQLGTIHRPQHPDVPWVKHRVSVNHNPPDNHARTRELHEDLPRSEHPHLVDHAQYLRATWHVDARALAQLPEALGFCVRLLTCFRLAF